MVKALASHQYGLGSIPAGCHMWVEFVGFRLALRVSVFTGFLPSTNTNTSVKFQFDQNRGHESENQLSLMLLRL